MDKDFEKFIEEEKKKDQETRLFIEECKRKDQETRKFIEDTQKYLDSFKRPSSKIEQDSFSYLITLQGLPS